jgi:5-methylcytosine-specific restriction endonuclease McrA
MDVKLRQFVRMRAAQHCEYCGLPQEFSELRFHIEHVTSRQHGGDDDADNLALACPDCNFRKGPNLTGIDPNTGAGRRSRTARFAMFAVSVRRH